MIKHSQNNAMRRIFYIISFILISTTFSAIFPYPIFSNHTNITEKVAYEINNYYESEISNFASQEVKLLPLNFSIMSSLIQLYDVFEVFDIETENSFTAVRIGGMNHLDIQAIDQQNHSALYEICGENWSWSRRPVLVRLNDSTFVPASISCYPHGYSNNSSINGHICLHFYDSKTDGTHEEDSEHKVCRKQWKRLH